MSFTVAFRIGGFSVVTWSRDAWCRYISRGTPHAATTSRRRRRACHTSRSNHSCLRTFSYPISSSAFCVSFSTCSAGFVSEYHSCTSTTVNSLVLHYCYTRKRWNQIHQHAAQIFSRGLPRDPGMAPLCLCPKILRQRSLPRTKEPAQGPHIHPVCLPLRIGVGPKKFPWLQFPSCWIADFVQLQICSC